MTVICRPKFRCRERNFLLQRREAKIGLKERNYSALHYKNLLGQSQK